MKKNLTQEDALETLIETIEPIRKEHKKFKGWDGILYNGGTVVVLFCTVSATFIPFAEHGWQYWTPKILSGFASFWIALDRAKSYGQRWQFHIERENQYGILVDNIKIFPAWPEDKKAARFMELVTQFERLRSSEANIPGTGKHQGLPTG